MVDSGRCAKSQQAAVKFRQGSTHFFSLVFFLPREISAHGGTKRCRAGSSRGVICPLSTPEIFILYVSPTKCRAPCHGCIHFKVGGLGDLRSRVLRADTILGRAGISVRAVIRLLQGKRGS
ncbi:hypothetical protein RRG08_038613 [Elysia crispata]|uniref:Uncharacterized protein n=1 Tax=Elysia crispata TaxID=231223 RepID=A0AAE1D0Z4_9GAST|nr:hypothetical protein RRG08_038613 [Elysia crispata]